ncbi:MULTISPECIES: ABC transporter permease [Glutamicibacter]|uniref:ABC transporter, inner membrane subunit n=1 Tax=Glutamicibacter arilaitensis (strain DSM 16368 / CIP 108037 / IAM 15318 / JCM 13566 / NCIMB 14258 / Re117) TaxID=861360 RepID=A0ABM9PUD3_GLUAR|nr:MULTISPECIES: FtsX-like permease family protein [Glutamicibacter]CBT74829.1 putative ABC transporter, inner membrane subunit [Glutamicibacter arilaitensis Re117]HCH48983.1 ABC transporter permease [Glutamicibacter sp.]HCJ53977.1 ABC transporter permease [Glutamicibacter sp.]
MLHVALSNIKTYARRYIAVILAVAIGTAFLAATLSVNSSTQATLKNSLGDAYKNADLVAYPDWDLASDGQDPTALSLKDVKEVQNLSAVTTAYGLGYVDGLLRTADDSYGVSMQPVDPDQGLGGMELLEGRAPQGSNEIIIDAAHAKDMGTSIGDVVALENGAASAENYTIVGIQRSTTNPRTSAYALAGMSEQAWKHFAGEQPLISEIVVNTDGSEAALQEQLEKLFADKKMTDIAVMSADEKVLNEVAQLTGGTDQLSVILLVFALIALVVTGLVVVNTFAVVIAQRTRELALLRILGAKRKQIRSSVLIEALVIGILASILGVLLAVVLMFGLIQLLHVLVPEMSYATLALTPQGLAIPILVGVLMTVIAASLPARRAMKLAPLAALRPFDAASVKNRAGKARIIFGILFLLAGASLLAYGAFKGDLIIAFLGGLVSFPGILMLASLFVPSSVSGIGKAVAGKSTAGKLAALNAVRNPGRTTATATALLIGVTLVSMIMVGGQTAKASLNNAVAAEFPVDMMVSFYDRKVSDSEIKSMLEKIGEVEGITAGSSFTSAYADVDMGTGEMYNSEIMSVDPEGFAEVALDPDIVPADGEIVYVLSNPENPTVKIGDQTLKVKKTEAMLSGNIVTEQTFDKLEVEEANQYTGILLKVDSDVRASAVNDLVTKISAITGVESSMINGGLVMKSMFSQIIDVLLMIVSALLAVAVLIALIGVANTLSLSILERTRENSLLRALGLKKKQLRGMLATEAVLIGGVAALLGLVLGVVYGLLGARSALASMGEMTYEIPWLQLALVLLISIVAALLASVTPGRRAAKLSPVEGLAVE